MKAILLEKCRAIQKQKKYKNYCNNSGYRVGQQVEVIYDNDNSYWKGRYTASRLVGKHAYVVGVTPCFVRIVTGSLWSRNLEIHCKKNFTVARAGTRGRILGNARARARGRIGGR